MKLVIKLSIHLVVYFCILATGKSFISIEDTDSHLNTYSAVNKTLHDNIDDSSKEHTHTHKHTKDGEKHEHGHEHSKTTQYETKLLNQNINIKITVEELENTQYFSYKNLTSDPHCLNLFRPPIA